MEDDLRGCVFRQEPGFDSAGRTYADSSSVWELFGQCWHDTCRSAWRKASANEDGVLGGITQIHGVDVAATAKFLDEIAFETTETCVDLCAGIGRVADAVLFERFEHVDLVDALPHMVKAAKKRCGDKPRKLICQSMRHFNPPANSYDLVFMQWSTDNARDDDLIATLKRCAASLKQGGRLVLKENHNIYGDGFYFDLKDGSITRSLRQFRRVMASASLRIVRAQEQDNLPSDLFPVRMWELAPFVASETSIQIDPAEHSPLCQASTVRMKACTHTRLQH
ncbi:MAG: hypothetical protein MHM6MM_003964 [Cercozoa sp. M6MM]